MNDTISLLTETADRILAEQCTADCVHAAEQGRWPQALWTVLEDSGLSAAALPETLGGSGLSIGATVALLRVAGYHAAPLPLVEHWLAGQALAAVGQPMPAPVLSFGLADGTASGTRAPWGRQLPVVVLGGEGGAGRLRLYTEPRLVRTGANLAGEPCDLLDLAASEPMLDVPLPGDASSWRARGALMRSAQMAGAMRRCLELSLSYAAERSQFGRPLAAFQAIQQQLAMLAAEVAAVDVAVEAAALAAERSPAFDEIAVAKARAGLAVEPVTRIAHQVHGAMGFTQEHRLHLSTRRLWSWRDDHGSETEWQIALGRRVVGAGGAGLWPFLTALGG